MRRAAKEAVALLKLIILRCLAMMRRRTVGPFGTAILTRTTNGLLLVPTSDVMVGRRLSFNGCYDPELLGFLLGKCDATSEVLFVGAHVGSLAIPVARKVKRVTAIEANPMTFDLLRMNVILNGVQNVELHNFAAGDRSGEVPFLASGVNSGGSSVEMNDGHQEEAHIYGSPEKITVQMRRLDDAFPGVCFDLIVMDIEGSEALALSGMSHLIGRSRALLVEVFEHHLRRIARVSNEEFLSFLVPHYEEAFVLPEKPRKDEPICSGPYPQSVFPEMMLECCRRQKANVMFLRTGSQHSFLPDVRA